MQSFSFPTAGSIPSDWKRNGRQYIVKTESLGNCFSPISGYWLYEPSVILPYALTGGKYVLLITRNKQQNLNETHGLVVTARTSDDGVTFGSEVTLIENTSQSVDNICDMIDARPIWDGSEWHIYVQARIGTPGVACPGILNYILEATGSSLNPPTSSSFAWTKESGNDHAKKIISGNGGDKGIGETMQWFNPSAYGLPSFPLMVTFNDWGCDDGDACGHATFNYLSQDDSSYDYWYGPSEVVYLEVTDFGSKLIFPDAILLGSTNAGRNGHPGIGFSSTCYNTDSRYKYCKGIGFFDNPSNVPYANPVTTPYTQSNAPNHGWPFAGALESTDSDTHGPRMNSPRVARNEYGYVPPVSYHGLPRSWVTYLYYNPAQAAANAGDQCDDYNTFPSQVIAVSQLTITETNAARQTT